jgi:ABC-type transport system involved in multi-copper enzyme maturation permease subunit
MLFYKAWRESRIRFLMCAAVVTFLCVTLVVRARTQFPVPRNPNIPYTGFIWANAFAGTFLGGNAIGFTYMALLLGLGGLQRERSTRTALFTLGLPVTRSRLVGARALVGLLELVLIAAIPVVLIPAVSPWIAGQHYPVEQAAAHAALYLAWGAVWYAVGLCWSIVLTGEFAPVIACVLTPIAYMIALVNVASRVSGVQSLSTDSTVPAFPAANFMYFMSGVGQMWPPNSGLFAGPLPWTAFTTLACVALSLLALAAAVTAHQDF